MSCRPNFDRRNRRDVGRARRPAMLPGAILAEMPRQLRQKHLGSGGVSTNPTVSKHKKRNKAQPLATNTKLDRRRGHERQHAMVWDDIVSSVHLEMMRSEQEKLPAVEKVEKTRVSIQAQHRYVQSTTTISSLNHLRRNTLTHLSDSEIPSSVYGLSPPRITRMTFCFDSNGCDQSISAFERVPRCLSGAMPRSTMPRMQTSFDRGTNNNICDSITHGDASTYVSSDDDDDKCDDESSLDYSDDNSEIERAILASVVIPCSMKITGEDAIHCAICLGYTDSSNLTTVSGCDHKFCFGCIDRWAEKKNECPLCKKSFHMITSRRKVRWY